jgi:uncharacterized membrane protein
MSERVLRLASAALAAAGAGLSGWLLYVRETGGTLACSTGGCETVQSSPYAELAGVPVAALGLAGFLALLAASLVHGERGRLAQATLALAAFLFSSYLLYVQAAVIGAICQWCVAVDVLVTGSAALALLRLRPLPEAAAPTSPAAPAAAREPAAAPGGRGRRERRAEA